MTFGADAEVILGVPVVDVFAQVGLVQAGLDPGLLGQAEQEVGEAGAAGLVVPL